MYKLFYFYGEEYLIMEENDYSFLAFDSNYNLEEFPNGYLIDNEGIVYLNDSDLHEEGKKRIDKCKELFEEMKG